MGKYKYGKITRPISLKDFRVHMNNNADLKLEHQAFLWFLYWTGVRINEALDRVKEDFEWLNNYVVVSIPAKKHGTRDTLLLPISLRGMEKLRSLVESKKKGRKVFDFTDRHGQRIVKKVLGKEYYPHFFRLNRAVHFLDDPTTTDPEMLAWFGWRRISTLQHYIGYSEKHIKTQAKRLEKEE